MTPRHVALTFAGLAVLAAGIYLFLEVKAAPATADTSKRPTEARVMDPPAATDDESDHEAPTTPRRDGRIPDRVRDTTPTTPTPTPAPVVTETEARLVDLNKDGVMAEANKAYDRGEYEDAVLIAGKVLKDDPTNVRMLRIMVSSSCIDGDATTAQKYFGALPGPDREQMRVRCARYSVTFTDK